MGDWVPVGKHELRVDGDVVFARAVGEISWEETEILLSHLQQVERQYGYAFEVVDGSKGGGMSAAARRKNAEWHRTHHIRIELVVFGAGLLLRTLLTLLTNAFRLLDNRKIIPHFVASEAEAWAWVEQRRAQLQAEKRSPTAGSGESDHAPR